MIDEFDMYGKIIREDISFYDFMKWVIEHRNHVTEERRDEIYDEGYSAGNEDGYSQGFEDGQND